MHITHKPYSEKGTNYSNSSSGKENLDVICYENLLAGITIFEFTKSDGSIRKAIGTLKQDLIPIDSKLHEEYKSLLKTVLEETEDPDLGVTDETFESIESLFKEKEKKERKPNETIQTYYDFESKGWRSFKKESLIAIYS